MNVSYRRTHDKFTFLFQCEDELLTEIETCFMQACDFEYEELMNNDKASYGLESFSIEKKHGKVIFAFNECDCNSKIKMTVKFEKCIVAFKAWWEWSKTIE